MTSWIITIAISSNLLADDQSKLNSALDRMAKAVENVDDEGQYTGFKVLDSNFENSTELQKTLYISKTMFEGDKYLNKLIKQIKAIPYENEEDDERLVALGRLAGLRRELKLKHLKYLNQKELKLTGKDKEQFVLYKAFVVNYYSAS